MRPMSCTALDAPAIRDGRIIAISYFRYFDRRNWPGAVAGCPGPGQRLRPGRGQLTGAARAKPVLPDWCPDQGPGSYVRTWRGAASPCRGGSVGGRGSCCSPSPSSSPSSTRSGAEKTRIVSNPAQPQISAPDPAISGHGSDRQTQLVRSGYQTLQPLSVNVCHQSLGSLVNSRICHQSLGSVVTSHCWHQSLGSIVNSHICNQSLG